MFSRNLASTSSRSKTPNSSTRSQGTSTPPPGKSSSTTNLPGRISNRATPSKVDLSWSGEDEGLDLEGEFVYNVEEDEDEFGLPSIANSRRAARRAGGPSLELPGDARRAIHEDISMMGGAGGRARANSSDIGDERGGPIYPTAKRSEGKILRPQYKEILKG